MAALDIVGLDLKVRHALGPSAIAEGEVAVGLKGLCAASVGANFDEAGVHAAGDIVDRAFEQQVGAGLGRDVLLGDAEVVSLRTVGEVERYLTRARALANELGVRAHSGIIATERHCRQQRG